MSLGVVVTEAAKKSGSYITATCALDFGRTVFAVPGPISNPYSVGTKNLVLEGATLITCGNDVLRGLGLLGENKKPRDVEKIDFTEPLEKLIYLQLLDQPLSADDLVEILQMDISSIAVSLSMMEMEDLVFRSGEKWQISL